MPMYMDYFVGPAAPYLQIAPEEFSNVVALTQMTPGPISVNAATFFGYRMGGVAGSALATACLLLPSLLLLVWALKSLDKWKASRVVQGVLRGVAPAAVGLMMAAALAFAGMSVWSVGEGGVSFHALGFILSAGAAWVFVKTRFPPVALIFACTALGLLGLIVTSPTPVFGTEDTRIRQQIPISSQMSIGDDCVYRDEAFLFKTNCDAASVPSGGLFGTLLSGTIPGVVIAIADLPRRVYKAVLGN